MTGTDKHSPRPWTSRYEFPGNRLYVTDATGRDIAQVLRYPGQAAQEANADLIAAAPDMLAEIDKQIEWLRHLRVEIGDSIRPSLLTGIDQSIKYLGAVSSKARGEAAS